MNDPKLKLAIAKMLPEQIDIFWRNEEPFFLWKRQDPDVGDSFVLETEWLYIVSLVEKELYDWADRDDAGQDVVNEYLEELAVISNCRRVCATFNQRAEALCKVKGINYEN